MGNIVEEVNQMMKVTKAGHVKDVINRFEKSNKSDNDVEDDGNIVEEVNDINDMMKVTAGDLEEGLSNKQLIENPNNGNDVLMKVNNIQVPDVQREHIDSVMSVDVDDINIVDADDVILSEVPTIQIATNTSLSSSSDGMYTSAEEDNNITIGDTIQ